MESTEHLAGAIERFQHAVHLLVGTRSGSIDTDQGYKRVAGDSLYVLMRDSVAGIVRESEGSAEKRSTPPLWLDCSSWVDTVDRASREWWLNGTGSHEHATVNRLYALADTGWRPQDVPWLNAATSTINGWVRKAENLLDGGRRWSLSAPCPNCGATHSARRDSAGELVRQPALQVTTLGCVCLACEYHWSPEYFVHLSQVLECSTPEGVLE